MIFVTGTPGIGKTTVSQVLAARLEATYVDISKLVEEEGLVSGIDRVRETLIADMDKVSSRVRKIVMSSQRDVVIDSHYILDLTLVKETKMVFVLRRNPEELKELMEIRGFKGRKVWENLAAEILDVCLWEAVSTYGSKVVCEIDLSGKGVEKIVEDMISLLEGRKRCEVGTVDWLGKLEAAGKLDDFLRAL